MSQAGYSCGGAGKENAGQINTSKPFSSHACRLIADIYISISMGTFEHREYKSRGEDGNK